MRFRKIDQRDESENGGSGEVDKVCFVGHYETFVTSTVQWTWDAVTSYTGGLERLE